MSFRSSNGSEVGIAEESLETGSNLPEKLRPDNYVPKFVTILSSLERLLKEHAREAEIVRSESTTTVPSIAIKNLSSSGVFEEGMYGVNSLMLWNGTASLTLTCKITDYARYYDIIVNVLHAWAGEEELLGVKMTNKDFRYVPEVIDLVQCYLYFGFTYKDYRADTSFPKVDAEKCVGMCDDYILRNATIV